MGMLIPWMGREVEKEPVLNCFDGYAYSMLIEALKAVHDFIEEGGQHEFWEQKLLYADTDLDRFTNAAMRMADFAERFSGREAPDAPPRRLFRVKDLAHALYNWRRQMRLWHGFYTWASLSGHIVARTVSLVTFVLCWMR